MIQLINNLLQAIVEYLKLKNKSFAFDKIDEYEKEKDEKISKLEALRNSGSNPDECAVLRERIIELNKRIEYLSTIDSQASKESEDSN